MPEYNDNVIGGFMERLEARSRQRQVDIAEDVKRHRARLKGDENRVLYYASNIRLSMVGKHEIDAKRRATMTQKRIGRWLMKTGGNETPVSTARIEGSRFVLSSFVHQDLDDQDGHGWSVQLTHPIPNYVSTESTEIGARNAALKQSPLTIFRHTQLDDEIVEWSDGIHEFTVDPKPGIEILQDESALFTESSWPSAQRMRLLAGALSLINKSV